MDFTGLRKEMVELQIAGRGVSDSRLLKIINDLPREKFVPEELVLAAYEDHPITIGNGQTISQPYIVALMTELLELKGNEKVLEVGTGSGYQTAILAKLASRVYSIERIPVLLSQARNILDSLGYQNIFLKEGDGSLGWPEEAPFERIIITAACPRIPLALSSQLAEGGKIVAPVGGSFSQMLVVAEKADEKLTYKEVCDCAFVPLVGKFGLRQED